MQGTLTHLSYPGAAGSRQKTPSVTETILLVEDEEAIRHLGTLILRSAGYTVLEASDGQEAVRVTRECLGSIDLLISDVVVPGGLCGRKLAEQVQKLHPETKVLFCSGYTDDVLAEHGIVEEQVDFLQKPFTPTTLTQKVQEVLDAPASRGV